MRVIFNGIVAYEEQHARLYNINEPEKFVSLFAPTNKCLSLLIETRPEVISQHVFFEKVWENEGLPVTANTFYQHIAMLRRALEEVGLNKDAIVTIPRKGLSLAETLDITFEEVDEAAADKTPINNNKNQPLPEQIENKSLTKLALTLLGIIFVFSVSFGLSLSYFDNAPQQTHQLENYKFLGEINGCRVFTFFSLSTLSDVKRDLQDNNIDCKTNENIYYATIPLLHRVSVITCTNGPENICRSYFSMTSR